MSSDTTTSESPHPLLPPPLPASPPSPPSLPMMFYPPNALARPEQPRLWPVFIAPAIMLGATLVIGMIIGVGVVIHRSATGARIDSDEMQRAVQDALTKPAIALPMFFSISLVTGAIALIAAKLSGAGIKRRLVLRPSTANPFTLLLLCIGTVCAGGCIETLMIMVSKGLHLQPGGAIKAIEDILKNASEVSIVLTAIVIALGPGIGEELLFRGYVQSRLHQRLGPWPAIGIAAVMFGIVHFDVMHTIITTPLGAYMGWAAYRTGSTRTSIGCHIFNNLTVVVLSTFPLPLIDEVSISTLWFLFFVYGAVGFFVTLIAHYMLPPAPAPEPYVPAVTHSPAAGSIGAGATIA